MERYPHTKAKEQNRRQALEEHLARLRSTGKTCCRGGSGRPPKAGCNCCMPEEAWKAGVPGCLM